MIRKLNLETPEEMKSQPVGSLCEIYFGGDAKPSIIGKQETEDLFCGYSNYHKEYVMVEFSNGEYISDCLKPYNENINQWFGVDLQQQLLNW